MLIPDYYPPDALLVPHIDVPLRPVLEAIALAACPYCGVILVSDDPPESRRLARTSPYPEHISIVEACPDTPWMRDLSPVPVAKSDGLHWLRPIPHIEGRERDAALFPSITRMPMEALPYRMPRGNVVAGPDGLMLSTTRFFSDNDLDPTENLDQLKEQLGVSSMLFFPPLSTDAIAHADCYVRFLSRNCVALAWLPDRPDFQSAMRQLADALRERLTDLSIAWIPVHAGTESLASPLNWIQLGRRLLVPDVPELSPAEKQTLMLILTGHGYEITWLPSPDISLGGSLHCLTASIYARCPEMAAANDIA